MLKIKNISKSFSGVKALENLSLEFLGGEVHALCGENGAGKSTLMNIITGNLQPDTGTLYWNGNKMEVRDVHQAKNLGIGIVYQELSLVDTLSVAENIYPNNQPLTRWNTIDHQQLYKNTENLLSRLHLNTLHPRQQVARLSPAEKQLVEIAKALAGQPQLLILDEPTASITEKETKILFSIINELKTQGVAVIYISHRMAEIQKIADKVSILKDGRYQGTLAKTEISENKIISMMVGRSLKERTFSSYASDEVVLEVQNLSGRGFSNVSFGLRRGEILGFAGLVGSGRTELATAIFGANDTVAGRILKKGKEININHPSATIRQGIAYVPEERKALGLFLDKTVSENIISSRLDAGMYRPEKNDGLAVTYQDMLAIKTPSVRQVVRKLSGGNQQKVVLAKWLHTKPEILIVDEPTHGVDVGAKDEIYNILEGLAAEGKSIIMISSEMPELLLLADRIAVMSQGKITAILPRESADEETIMRHATVHALTPTNI